MPNSTANTGDLEKPARKRHIASEAILFEDTEPGVKRAARGSLDKYIILRSRVSEIEAARTGLHVRPSV